MAFEKTGQAFLKSKDLKVGQSITGYVVGKHNGGQFPEIDNLIMELKEGITANTKDGDKHFEPGQRLILNSAGSLKYFFKNGNGLGYLYRITRMEDRPNKRKQIVSNFMVEVDKTDKVDVAVQAPTSYQSDEPPYDDSDAPYEEEAT